MNPMDSHPLAADLHRRDLERAAEQHRLARRCRRARTGPSALLRLYARVWWASRPRVDAWGSPAPPPRALAS